jgi:hypothetical protein
MNTKWCPKCGTRSIKFSKCHQCGYKGAGSDSLTTQQKHSAANPKRKTLRESEREVENNDGGWDVDVGEVDSDGGAD